MKISSLLSQWRRFFPYLLVGLVLALRHPLPLTRPEFWSEDSSELFAGALAWGYKSLVIPVFGYSFFIERAIAYFASFFPIVDAPFIYACFSLVLASISMGYFSRDGFAWILPSRLQRIFVCVVLSLGPGTPEVMLNLINLASVFTWLFILLIIEDSPQKLSWTKLSILTVLLFSSGQLFLYAPLVALMGWVYREKRYAYLLLSFILVTLLNYIGNSHGNRGNLNFGNIVHMPRVLLEQFFERLTLMPLLGPQVADRIISESNLVFGAVGVALTLILIGLIYRFNRVSTKEQRTANRILFGTFATALACAIFVMGTIVVVRNYALIQLLRPTAVSLWCRRYSFPIGCVVLTIWLTVLLRMISETRLRILERGLAFGLTCLICTHVTLNSGYDETGYDDRSNDLQWPKKASIVQQFWDKRASNQLKKTVILRGLTSQPNWIFYIGIPASGTHLDSKFPTLGGDRRFWDSAGRPIATTQAH